MNWSDLDILITGGTGSFGRHFATVMLSEYRPRRLVILSRDELKQHEMRAHGIDGPAVRYFIGDVRDVDRLRRAFQGVDVVVHAAALKQVPACEYNPIEAVRTNIGGAQAVIDAALDAHVGKVIALSTDKAVAPLNLYGATKLVAEKLFIQANAYSGGHSPRFSCVRYGNVVGSRGSVVPVFLKQRRAGRLSITDDRMTRFWITLDAGVRFVISSLQRMTGGEVFIPKLPSMRVTDLADAIAPDVKRDVIGIRGGEKLHESLISKDEARQAVDLGDCYAITPTHPWWSDDVLSGAASVPEEFEYSSNTNSEWLSRSDLLRMTEALPDTE